MDFILNGQAQGTVASRLMQNGFNVNILRPYIGSDGHSYVTVMNAKGEPEAIRTNATATLRKDDWKLLDTAVLTAARQRLKFVADLRRRGLTFNIPNGMSKTVLETERMTDPGEATISMDGLRQGKGDRPEFDLTNLPLPILHSDFEFSARQVMVSRNGGTPLDTAMAEASSRRVAELAERLALGTYGTYTFGGGTIYGLRNFPQNLSQSLTDPTDTGWTPEDLVDEILEMRQKLYNARHYGPFVIYSALNWDRFLDKDYSAQKGDNTLRERIRAINGIEDVITLDFLEDYDLIMVQLTTDVIREVIGMDFTTVQWETMGGLQLNFKVMAILVPQIRADINNRTGICHGAVS